MSRTSNDAAARRTISASPFYGLSLAAGCADAISFVQFHGVFTANMTGNTVLLGIAIASRAGPVFGNLGILRPLLAIAAFVIGACATLPLFRGGFVAKRAARIVVAEGLIVALAGAVFITFHGAFVVPLCICIISFLMGAQSIVAANAGLPGITTTYVTGTLIAAVTRGFASGADSQRRWEGTRDGLAWCAYLGGTVVGALLVILTHNAALFLAALIFVLLGVAMRSNFAQFERRGLGL